MENKLNLIYNDLKKNDYMINNDKYNNLDNLRVYFKNDINSYKQIPEYQNNILFRDHIDLISVIDQLKNTNEYFNFLVYTYNYDMFDDYSNEHMVCYRNAIKKYIKENIAEFKLLKDYQNNKNFKNYIDNIENGVI